MTWEEFKDLIDYCCEGKPLGSGYVKKDDGKYYIYLKALNTRYESYGVTPFNTKEEALERTEFVLDMIENVLKELGYQNRIRVGNN